MSSSDSSPSGNTAKILVPLDNTKISEEVLRFADSWAQETGSQLLVMHSRTAAVQELVDQGELIDPQEAFDERVRNFPLHSECEIHHRFGRPSEVILRELEEHQPRLVIMAAHSHTLLGRLFLGSTTDTVLHKGHTSVYVYKRASLDPKEILVPVDLSAVSVDLLKEVDEIAMRRNGRLHLLHVMDLPEVHLVSSGGAFYSAITDSRLIRRQREEYQTFGMQRLKGLLGQVELRAPVELHVDFGTPYLRILGIAQQINAGLIAVGAHDHSTLGRVLMGSNTDYIVHHFEGSVYVHKEPAASESEPMRLGSVE
jgi:nucleotide-binding universal stress UspA family protein